MKQPKTINIFFVALASCFLHGTLAVMFAPFLSALMLSFGALPAPFHTIVTAEHGMIFAVVTPFVYGTFGFVFGALMAWLFNMFVRMLVRTEPPLRAMVEPTLEAQSATMGDAA